MEMMSVKSEVYAATKQHRLSILEGDDVAAPKCVKRRRRDSSRSSISSGTVGVSFKAQQSEQTQVDKSVNIVNTNTSTVKRSSRFRGVSRHRWTGRYEAHLWDKGSWNPTQRKKGKQVYLGAYDEEESAARAYDLAALKYWGTSTFTNFPVSEYEEEIEIMKNLSKEEYLASLRRRSSGFSRGVSKYRGVARHHHNGRWEARIGRVFGNKYLYLGTYSTQEEAAHAYDIAAIEYRGINAVTNFDLSTYIRWLRPVSNSLVSHQPKLPPLITTNNSDTNTTSSTTSNSFLIPTDEKPDTSMFNLNPLTTLEDLDNPKHQDFYQSQIIPFSPYTTNSSTSSSSSPSALGLLLKSSVFRDLVEKNTCIENEDHQVVKRVSQMKDNHFDIISYDGIGNVNSYALLGLETQDESATNPRGQNLWKFSSDFLLSAVDYNN